MEFDRRFLLLCAGEVLVVLPPSPMGPMPRSLMALRSSSSRAATSGFGLRSPMGRNSAFLASAGARSKVPPIPTPTMVGGHGLGPASAMVRTTNSLIPFQPCAGFSMAMRDMFSDPPPLAMKRMRRVSPGTTWVWMMAGVLSPVFLRVRGWHMDLRRNPLS
ncbi:MAG: hypothetical protein PWP17_1427 [Desulfomicrobiaceae bacterium]|nr:hypothetical protein [Desulfomicrobiaceae bacterium]